jgi:hypothetical protein
MLINYSNTNKSAAEGKTEDEGQLESTIKGFQGDENAGKIMYVELDDGDTKPEFVSFKGTNYDKEFNVTLASSQANIGKAFNQPPILRAENVGANFGADLMKNAYDYYNSVPEKRTGESVSPFLPDETESSPGGLLLLRASFPALSGAGWLYSFLCCFSSSWNFHRI